MNTNWHRLHQAKYEYNEREAFKKINFYQSRGVYSSAIPLDLYTPPYQSGIHQTFHRFLFVEGFPRGEEKKKYKIDNLS